MRAIVAASVVGALACACTSLEGLVDGGGAGDAGDDASVPDDAAVLADAAAQDAADAGVLFADSFDDAVPLPRSWGAATGNVVIKATPDAPSPGGILVARSSPPHAVAFLRKGIATPGMSELSCRFKVRLQQYGGFFQLTTAELKGSGTTYYRFDLTADEWTAYGQQAGTPPDFTERRNGSFLNVWLDVTLTLNKTGKVTIRVGSDVTTKDVLPFGTDMLVFTLGIERVPNEAFDYELAYDDVSCIAR